MAPRRAGRRGKSQSQNGRRRGRPPAASASAPPAATNSSFGSADAQAVLTRVAQLVQENQTLIRENNELKSTLAQIAEATQMSMPSPPSSSDGQSETASAPSTPSTGNGRRRRRRRGRISDPTTLERRRAALAKAREVLAAKRAAAKRGRPGA
jgi:hypothetical protein